MAYTMEAQGTNLEIKEHASYDSDGLWSTLQMNVLNDMLLAAVRANDPLAAWSSAARLLRGHYPLITPSDQAKLANALTSAAKQLPVGTRCSDPALPFIRLDVCYYEIYELKFSFYLSAYIRKVCFLQVTFCPKFTYANRNSSAKPREKGMVGWSNTLRPLHLHSICKRL